MGKGKDKDYCRFSRNNRVTPLNAYEILGPNGRARKK